ncbi:phosphatase PAP2 family protein [Candidatus Deianiraea vastatrix]|nr:phosphatase PAP2 family protein [Candidatus Deianiraea vastatrix]
MSNLLINSAFNTQFEMLVIAIFYCILATIIPVKSIIKSIFILIVNFATLPFLKKMINVRLSDKLPICFKGTQNEWDGIVSSNFAMPSGHAVSYTIIYFGALFLIYGKYFKAKEFYNISYLKKILVSIIAFIALFLLFMMLIRINVCGFHSADEVIAGVFYGTAFFILMNVFIVFVK